MADTQLIVMNVKCNIISTTGQLKRKQLVLLWKIGGMSWRAECLIWILKQRVEVPQAKNGITIFIKSKNKALF